MSAAILAAIFPILAAGAHLSGIAIAIVRCRERRAPLPRPAHEPAVSIIIPVCGLENYSAETARSAFLLDYSRYELIFCAARADDPVVPLIRRMIADHPWIDARLLIGDERISSNPKLNNVFKGWQQAAHAFVAITDGNVLLRRDYIQSMFAALDPETGVASSPPIGCLPQGFWAEVECAFLNGYQARWQYFADTIGLGFAQGKTLFWRRGDLERAGGIRALGCEIAEDAASTKIVREAGLRVRLMQPPVHQPLGARNAAEVWRRQQRWARLRRGTFPLFFVPEALAGALVPVIAAGIAADIAGYSALAAAAAFAAIWYGGEMLMALACGWPVSRYFLACAMLRDLMLPLLWLDAWRANTFEWRGTPMDMAENMAENMAESVQQS